MPKVLPDVMGPGFYDRRYFDTGELCGLSNYSDYRWIESLSVADARTFAELLSLDAGDTTLDIGCARGFLVRALVGLGVDAFGYDWSDFAIGTADSNVRQRVSVATAPSAAGFRTNYTAGIASHVLEHLSAGGVATLLRNARSCMNRIAILVPLGDGVKYYNLKHEKDVSHVLRQPLNWWCTMLEAQFGCVRARVVIPDETGQPNIGLCVAMRCEDVDSALDD